MTDLVQRLRQGQTFSYEGTVPDIMSPDMNEAADRIEQLERENAELRKQLQSEHERQHRVWTEIQSQHRDHSPLSMTVEFDNRYIK